MSATEYTVDLRDIKFVLFEQLRVHEQLAAVPRYKDFDKDMYEAVLDMAADLAVNTIAPVNKIGDREGVKLDSEGNVTTPACFKPAYQAIAEAGLVAASTDPVYGGQGLPHVVDIATHEMISGAATAFNMYPGLTRAAANLLTWEGTPTWIREAAVHRMLGGQWGGTMCLTEAGAGTAVGDNRAKASPTADPNVFHLTGEKVFISGGDQDLTTQILHLILARAPDAPPGTKGLSIFVVPKFMFDAEGNLGARNDAKVVGIEHKMGINGSATCTIALGATGTCVGYLLGSLGQGMEIMFRMMNEARIGVGIQSLGLASGAYQNALAYCKERVQGSAVENFRDADPPRITINKHPDVRRMLMSMKCQVDAMRSLIYSVGNRFDKTHYGADTEKEYLLGLVELMTPIVKAHCSDKAFEVCVTALQCFGGYGYIGEYPAEQYVRDAKITSIYEGTNGIQAMDLLGRKMRKGQGMLFMAWLNEANEELERCRAVGPLAEEVAALERGRDQLGQTAMHLGMVGGQGNLRGAMLQATPFLELFGTVVLGLHSIWQARVAQEAIQSGATGADLQFYKGKVANARFYMKNVLPRATAMSKAIQAGDESCLEEGLFE
ncbi:acyl-CoA dehydrogenase [Deltaproteobacteria bacterium]|nr:acyl-CoA dehydrogenase [Deltaproteobacteria bacterium]